MRYLFPVARMRGKDDETSVRRFLTLMNILWFSL
jgi:hypothetical protein